MSRWPLSDLAGVMGGRWLTAPDADAVAEGVTIDTRTAGGGELFVAIEGERFDGHQFCRAAAEAGCAAAMVAEDRAPAAAEAFGGPTLAVPDTLAAVQQLARWHRQNLPAAVVAVTGSNGKTTVKRMLDTILSASLRGVASPKSFNNHIGVPLTLLSAGADDQYVICEVGTNHPGEIAALGAICRPDLAAVISLAEAHLEGFGSIEAIADEKISLLDALDDGGTGVVWADSPLLIHRARPATGRCRLVRFGCDPAAEVRLTDYRPHADGLWMQVNGQVELELSVPGRHNALNATAALAIAGALGLPLSDAAAALAGFAGTDMRLQCLFRGDLTVINDAYNANPQSMRAAAAVLAEQPGRRRVLIAGDMRELGPTAEALHAQTGRAVAAAGVDRVVGVGPLGSALAAAAGQAGADWAAYSDVPAAVEALGEWLEPGDVVLLKGSRAMALEQLIEPMADAARRGGWTIGSEERA